MYFINLFAQQILQNGQIPLPRAEVSSDNIAVILRMVFAIAGGITMLIIVISGLRFVVANGDPASVAKAKNTIIYALIGLVVSISGYMIVRYVVYNI